MVTLEDYLGPLAAELPPRNQVNPENLVAPLIGSEIALTSIMVLFMVARYYTRIHITRMFGWDDIIMTVAAALVVTKSTLVCLATRHGTGYHLWDIDPNSISEDFQFAFWIIMLVNPATSLTKIAVLMGYLKIFPDKPNRWFCYSMIAYCAGFGICVFFAQIFGCRPISLFWREPFQDGPHCVDKIVLYSAAAAMNSVGDLLVYLWPAKYLFRLHLPLRDRVALCFVFCIGVCVFAVSLVRIGFLPTAVHSFDFFYVASKLHFIACVEGNLGIICGGIASTKGLLVKFPSDRRSSAGNNNKNSANTMRFSDRSEDATKRFSKLSTNWKYAVNVYDVEAVENIEEADEHWLEDVEAAAAEAEAVALERLAAAENAVIVKTQTYAVSCSAPSDEVEVGCVEAVVSSRKVSETIEREKNRDSRMSLTMVRESV